MNQLGSQVEVQAFRANTFLDTRMSALKPPAVHCCYLRGGGADRVDRELGEVDTFFERNPKREQ